MRCLMAWMSISRHRPPPLVTISHAQRLALGVSHRVSRAASIAAASSRVRHSRDSCPTILCVRPTCAWLHARRNGEVTLEEFTIAIRASLRVAKSAQLESLAQPTATQSARTRLPAVGAAYLTNVSPSTRNRVGRVSPRTARLDTVQERVLMRGTGATRYVGHSNGGAAAAVASVPPHTASRSNTPRVALRGATGAALGGSAVPTSTSPRSPRRTVEPPHAILPPVLRARPAPRKVAVEEEAEWYARVLNRSDVGQLLGQLNARDALLAERMSSAA